jgi:Peptidase_C39 like family
MTYPRYLRERFRHLRAHNLRQRVGKLPVMSAAAMGAVTFAVLPATQSMSATTGGHDQAAVVDVAALPGKAALDAAALTKNGETSSETKTTAETAKAEKPAPATVELYYQYGVQTNGWYCGPAATRMALSARGIYPSQDALAAQLGTTVNGTNSSADIARVLNAVTKTSNYQATSIPSKSVSKQQVEKLRADIVDNVSHAYPVVMNIVGSGTDVDGNTHTFDGGHYIAVVGYRDNGNQVKIGDSANPNTASYWISTSNLANWAGTRGYAA